MKTASLVGRRPDWSSACSARCDSPLNPSTSVILFGLTVIPTKMAKITKPNQPRIAALRWVALQRPIRPARVVEFREEDGEEDMARSRLV